MKKRRIIEFIHVYHVSNSLLWVHAILMGKVKRDVNLKFTFCIFLFQKVFLSAVELVFEDSNRAFMGVCILLYDLSNVIWLAFACHILFIEESVVEIALITLNEQISLLSCLSMFNHLIKFFRCEHFK